jgi:hypothetical protein
MTDRVFYCLTPHRKADSLPDVNVLPMQDSIIPTPESLFDPFEALVREYMQAVDANKNIADIKSALWAQSSRIRYGLMHIQVKNNNDFQRSVRIIQLGLIEMIDHVVMVAGAQDIARSRMLLGPGYHSTAGDLFKGLLGMLEYLDYQYPEQFNHNMPLGDGLCGVWKVQIEEQLYLIYQWFDNKGLPEEWCELVVEPFCEIMMPENWPLAKYRAWRYQVMLWSQLLTLTRSRLAGSEEALMRLLLRFNFNNGNYMEYCMHYIRSELSSAVLTAEERSVRVRNFRYLIESATPNRNMALVPENDALHTRLLVWIDGNFALNREVTELQDQTMQLENQLSHEEVFRKERLWTVASVMEIAGFYRLLDECDVFREKIVAKIVRHIAFGYSTAGSEEPREGNIRKAYDNPSEVALRFAEEICRKMIQLIADIRSGKKTLEKRRRK